MNYQYPIEDTWTKHEIIDVINFLSLVEQAHESNVSRIELLTAYRKFKEIVPSIGEERIYFSEFEEASGYSCYQTMKKVKEEKSEQITMKSRNV